MDYSTKTFASENFTITVHKPILTDSERKSREQEVINALERFAKEQEKRK